MSRRAVNHNPKGMTLSVRRPKSKLRRRRIKAKARVRQAERQAAVQAAMAQVPMFV